VGYSEQKKEAVNEGRGGHKRKKNITISKLSMARSTQKAHKKNLDYMCLMGHSEQKKELVKAVVGTNAENITISKLLMARSPHVAQKISITCACWLQKHNSVAIS
jgi:hypothetical protein